MLTRGSIGNNSWYRHITDKCTHTWAELHRVPDWCGRLGKAGGGEKAYTFLNWNLTSGMCGSQCIYERSECCMKLKFWSLSFQRAYVWGINSNWFDWTFLLLGVDCAFLRITQNRFTVQGMCSLVQVGIQNLTRISFTNHVRHSTGKYKRIPDTWHMHTYSFK